MNCLIVKKMTLIAVDQPDACTQLFEHLARIPLSSKLEVVGLDSRAFEPRFYMLKITSLTNHLSLKASASRPVTDPALLLLRSILMFHQQSLNTQDLS